MKCAIKQKLVFLTVLIFSTLVFAQDLKRFTVIEAVREHDLNPQTTSYASDAQMLTGLYEGLFTYDPVNLSPTYAIATDYRISRDKKRWTFTINANACFSNGEKITAADVRDSWLRLLSTPNAPYASLLDVIVGAEAYRTGKGSADEVAIYANTESSLSIHLIKPANYLPRVLCHSAFSIVHRNPTVYSGPFYLDDMQAGYYSLKKNEYYWDKDSVELDQIVFYQSNDEIENAYYFNTGIADWVTASLDTSYLIDKNAFHYNAEFATSYFFFKADDSVWSYPEFRTALFEAVPWEELRKDYYVQAQTFVYPLSGYPEINGYSYTDAAEAKNLMDAAREKYGIAQDKTLTLLFEMPENSVSSERLALLSDAWAPLGVELQVRTKTAYEYYGNVRASNANMFIYTWIGDFADPLAFLELFRGDSTLNDSGWKNAEYDRLINEAAGAGDEERYKLLGQAETILLDSCMVIPVHHPVISNVIDKNTCGGWTENAFDIHPLKYLYKKTAATTVPNVVMK